MYKLYATLIDGFQDYLSSSDIYQRVLGVFRESVQDGGRV